MGRQQLDNGLNRSSEYVALYDQKTHRDWRWRITDVVFLMDNTGSMGGPINSTKRNAQSILDAISGGDPRFAGGKTA